MNLLTAKRTGFVIVRRLLTIKDADCILVMDQGQIIKKGIRRELVETQKSYANLYNSQFV
jgi:ABC-type multidrug transport system fused ATPase/permease subunit